MISVNKAIDIVLENEKDVTVASVFDIGHSYVISVIGLDGYELDEPPFAVNKNTGELTSIFPPDHIEEFQNAKEIDFNKIQQ